MAHLIKINRGLTTLLAKDNTWLKALSVFYALKFYYKGGIILNISKRYSFFADELKISETNLRAKIKFLIDNGLIERKNNCLYFVSFNKIKEKFKIKTTKFYKLSYRNPKQLEFFLKTLIIKENLEKQEYKLKEKIINEELKKFGKIEARTIRNKVRKYLKKNISQLRVKYQKRELLNSSNKLLKNHSINNSVTISRKKIASELGKKSKSTGTRFIKKIKSLGLVLEDNKRIERIQSKVSFQVIRYFELDSSFFIFKNNLYKRLPNQLTLSNFLA